MLSCRWTYACYIIRTIVTRPEERIRAVRRRDPSSLFYQFFVFRTFAARPKSKRKHLTCVDRRRDATGRRGAHRRRQGRVQPWAETASASAAAIIRYYVDDTAVPLVRPFSGVSAEMCARPRHRNYACTILHGRNRVHRLTVFFFL